MFFSLSFFVFTFYVWKRTKINETEGQIYVVNFPAFSDITFSFNNDTDKRFKAMQKMEYSVKLWKNKNWMIEIYLSFLSLIIEAFLSSFSTQYLLNEDQNNKMLFFLQLTIIISVVNYIFMWVSMWLFFKIWNKNQMSSQMTQCLISVSEIVIIKHFGYRDKINTNP